MTTISRVMFTDGVAVEEGSVRIVIAGNLQSGNFNLTRLFQLCDQNDWYSWDVETIVVSVSVVTKPQRIYFALGRDGKIFRARAGEGFFQENIPDAGTGKGKYGYLSEIVEIKGEMYICGNHGQVYKRTDKGWIHIDHGILEKIRKQKPLSLNSIDGTGPEDIYVVGDYGQVFHYDGKKWSNIDVGTNLHLRCVKCASPNEVYIGGKHGILLKGSRNTWTSIDDLKDEDSCIWDMELFENNLYLSFGDTVMVYDGKSVIPVDTKLEPQIDAYHLSARNGILWSFGEEDIAFFDGKKWTRVIHPDNV